MHDCKLSYAQLLDAWRGEQNACEELFCMVLELRESIDMHKERIQQLTDALADARSGLNYIRETHGELYGVGFDRVEQACAALLKETDKWMR